MDGRQILYNYLLSALLKGGNVMIRRNLILLGLFFLAGCSLSGTNEKERQVIDVPALSVEVIETTEQSVTFEFKGRLPVPCYEFEEAVVDRSGQKVHVKVRAHSTAELCVTVLGVLKVPSLEIGVGEEGTYMFYFWRGEQAPVEVEVTVP